LVSRFLVSHYLHFSTEQDVILIWGLLHQHDHVTGLYTLIHFEYTDSATL